MPTRALAGGDTPGARRCAQFIVLLATTNKVALPANPARAYLLIQNKSPVVFYIGLGQAASIGGGIEIAPGGSFEPQFPPTEDIQILGTYTNQPALIVEGRYAWST